MDLLNSGTAFVRKWWVNENSSKNQCGVQFVQKVSKPVEGASLLVALAQGNENADSTIPTAVMSFSKDVVVQHLGSESGTFLDENDKLKDNAMTAKALFSAMLGKEIPEVNIQIEENFSSVTDNDGNIVRDSDNNPIGRKQNPSTNQTVRAFDENGELKDVYRHTTMVAGPVKNIFVKSATRAEINAYERQGSQVEESTLVGADEHGV